MKPSRSDIEPPRSLPVAADMKPPRSLPVAAPRGGFAGGPAEPDPRQSWVGRARFHPFAFWHRLPRDARDTLFVVAVIGWTLLPHASHLPLWCSLLAGVILVWRARLALVAAPLPPRWMVALVLTGAVAATLWTERTLFGRDAGVTLLVVLMALKTLELRARRDALVIFFLGFFLVLTHFLYSQSLPVAVSMLVSVWGLLAALVLAHMPVGRPSLARAGALAARAALFGAPVMVLLFVLFPRLPPLWGLPQDGAGRTGLSGSLRMGGVAEVANDDSVAMRVRFLNRVPDPDALYFRGPVLGQFDGREWTRLPPTFGALQRARAELQLIGAPVEYELTIEPSRLPLLPMLEMTPDRIDAAPELEGWSVSLRADQQWQVDRPVTERVRVTGKAWPIFRHGPRGSAAMPREYLALPPGFNPRIRQWAAELRAQRRFAGADTQALVQAVYDHIRGEGFTYTLEPGPYGLHAADEFWFDRRIGFCEHFASGFVIVMRAMGVPARIVTGYQGTDPTPVDGYYIVRQSHAHAWAEYWREGSGWVRADPTAAVAPERIRVSRNLAPPRGLVASALDTVNPAFAAQMRALWEGVNNRWNQWVLNYSRNQQFALLRDLGFESPSWQDLAYVLIGLLCAGSLAGAGWAVWDRWREDPWQRLQRRIAARLALLGIAVAPHEAPRRRAEAVRSALGGRGEPLAAALESLDRLRYAAPGQRLPPRQWWSGFVQAAEAAATGAVR